MTNREFYKEQILDIVCDGSTFGVDKTDNTIRSCYDLGCSNCKFANKSNYGCSEASKEWAYSEYVEPCPFENDELVEVSIDGRYWELRYFAYQKDGVFYCWNCEHKSTETTGVCNWEYCQKYGTLGGLVKGDAE